MKLSIEINALSDDELGAIRQPNSGPYIFRLPHFAALLGSQATALLWKGVVIVKGIVMELNKPGSHGMEP